MLELLWQIEARKQYNPSKFYFRFIRITWSNMGTRTGKFIHLLCILCLAIYFLSQTSTASVQKYGKIYPGFEAFPMERIDDRGLFLVSNSSKFAFGFRDTKDITLFLLVIVHIKSWRVVWSANRGSPIHFSDTFVFEKGGNVVLRTGGNIIWSTNTNGKEVSAMEMQDTGNLVLIGTDSEVLWQSFSFPTDTLLSNQRFIEGMKLISDPSRNNFAHFLQIKSGDMFLYADYQTPQPYWSMGKENSKIILKSGGKITQALLNANSWVFSDRSNVSLWQFIFSDTSTHADAIWAAVLESDGTIVFYDLQTEGSLSPVKIPSDQCSTPESCDPYYICSGNKRCRCPSILNSSPNCSSGIASPCNHWKGTTELATAGNGLTYPPLMFVQAFAKMDLTSCKNSCLHNCSCLALFFRNESGECYMFDQIGSLQKPDKASGFISFVKVSTYEGNGRSGSSHRQIQHIVVVNISVVLVISGTVLLYAGFLWYRKRQKMQLTGYHGETSEELKFLELSPNYL